MDFQYRTTVQPVIPNQTIIWNNERGKFKETKEVIFKKQGSDAPHDCYCIVSTGLYQRQVL